MIGQMLGSGTEERTYAVVFEQGDEVMEGLNGIARTLGWTAARLTGLGGFREATLGFFDPASQSYQQIPVGEQVEVLTLTGDVVLKDDQPEVHAHVIVGKRDGTAHGGHLMRAIVRPTLEVLVVESPAHLRRTYDERTGLSLLKLRR